MNNENKETLKSKRSRDSLIPMGIGVALGVALGAALNNIALGLVSGIVLAGLVIAWEKKK